VRHPERPELVEGRGGNGGKRLTASLRRLFGAPPPRLQTDEPASDEREQLNRIEQMVNSQNRLLLFTILGVIAELLFKLLKP